MMTTRRFESILDERSLSVAQRDKALTVFVACQHYRRTKRWTGGTSVSASEKALIRRNAGLAPHNVALLVVEGTA